MMVVGRDCGSADCCWGGGGDLLGERCIVVSVYLLGVVFVIAISIYQSNGNGNAWVELIAILQSSHPIKQAQPAKKWVRGACVHQAKKARRGRARSVSS